MALGLKRICLVVLAGILAWQGWAWTMAAKAAETAVVTHGKISVDGQTRTYVMALPPGAAADAVLPLVLVFHGFHGNGERMMNLTGMNAIAAREHFRVVYPDGQRERWQGDAGPDDASPVDVNFVDALLNQLQKDYGVDANRVYATGFSSGGFFTQRLACDLPDRFAAVVPVAATLGVPLSQRCQTGKPIPTMMINGKDDPIVTWEGEIKRVKHSFPLSRILSVQETQMWLARRNSCPMTLLNSTLENRDPHDGTHSERVYFPECPKNQDVSHIVVYGGGHTWPGSKGTLSGRLFTGRTTHDFSASEEIWTFFKTHSKGSAKGSATGG